MPRLGGLMTDRTIHGWPVIADGSSPKLKLFTIPGTKRKIKLHKQLGPYLVAFAAEYHQLIAPIDEGTLDDWGWAPVRKGRASDQISDHCAGVAMDLNATGPDGRQGHGLTWWLKNPVKYARLKRLLKKYRLLEAGITYTRFLDPMHYTFKHGVGTAAVLAEIKKLGIGPNGAVKA